MVTLIIALILLGILYVSSKLDNISQWLQNADFEEPEEPKDLSDDMDNSEYDWGHNIKNYMEE